MIANYLFLEEKRNAFWIHKGLRLALKRHLSGSI